MKIVVSGSSGLLGSAICRALHERGDVVVRLVRDRCSANDQGMSSWNPRQGNIDPGAFAGADAVIHLAGESIAGGRWSRARKERILASRIDSTRLIVSALHEIATPPLSLLCASAVGFYGHRADQSLDEASAL
ncbi:MAG TPA: NAD-dependent epimerase/dehydratase family protein, partial [Candidatus Glassbacteria bacterium]|nr:NAD-dependent epimerase/dehydratase family protein [Candidatus Glassbacteria bacterium]